jgi:hypothetical protein
VIFHARIPADLTKIRMDSTGIYSVYYIKVKYCCSMSDPARIGHCFQYRVKILLAIEHSDVGHYLFPEVCLIHKSFQCLSLSSHHQVSVLFCLISDMDKYGNSLD